MRSTLIVASRVRMYRTADGRLFEDRAKAAEHVADACREFIAGRLDPLTSSGHLSHSDVYRIVCTLIPDSAAAAQMAETLASKFAATWGDCDDDTETE